jgi:hypothetical protein
MNLTKDTYEYILNFATDRDIINMLSSNRKFRDEKLFERVMKKKYPLIIRFKDENISWINFFIQTVYYLSKLKEEYDLAYIPSLDFDPKFFYNIISLHKNINKETFEDIDRIIKENSGKKYHTIAKLIGDRYVVDPHFTKGSSFGSIFSPNIFKRDNEVMIDVYPTGNNKEYWLTIELQDGIDENSGLDTNKETARKFLYDNYISTVESFIEEMMDVNGITEEEVILQHSTLDLNWRDRDNFYITSESQDYPFFYLYTNLPNVDKIRFDFRLIRIYL